MKIHTCRFLDINTKKIMDIVQNNKNDEQLLFSVFTPVFNRKHTIHRVWESLLAQTYRNFEWIVVDDGSTDDVYDLLEEYKRKADFKVILLRQENKGKHSAWNRAVELAEGELFVPADSDDSFIAATLERFAFHWLKNIPDSERNRFSGINVLCKDPDTDRIIGSTYPGELLVSDNLELHYKYKMKGEKWGCIRTDILRERPNKEVKGSFLPETWIWFFIARKYKVLCVNEALRNYFTEDEKCLSKSTDPARSAESQYTYLSWHLSADLDYLFRYESFARISKNFINLWRFGILSGKKTGTIISDLDSYTARIIALIFLIPSIVVYYFTFLKS